MSVVDDFDKPAVTPEAEIATTTWNDLPDDVIEHIFSFLSFTDRGKARVDRRTERIERRCFNEKLDVLLVMKSDTVADNMIFKIVGPDGYIKVTYRKNGTVFGRFSGHVRKLEISGLLPPESTFCEELSIAIADIKADSILINCVNFNPFGLAEPRRLDAEFLCRMISSTNLFEFRDWTDYLTENDLQLIYQAVKRKEYFKGLILLVCDSMKIKACKAFKLPDADLGYRDGDFGMYFTTDFYDVPKLVIFSTKYEDEVNLYVNNSNLYMINDAYDEYEYEEE